jgi:hypothetical protein
MHLSSLLTCVCGLVLAALFATEAHAQKKAVPLTKQWKGSVEDEKLQKGAPEFITNDKALEKLWKSWKVEGKVPMVDFKKEIVVVGTGGGSKLNLSASLDENGDLTVLGATTLDFVPGFRYVIATLNREGVKSVNKKAVPAD